MQAAVRLVLVLLALFLWPTWAAERKERGLFKETFTSFHGNKGTVQRRYITVLLPFKKELVNAFRISSRKLYLDL